MDYTAPQFWPELKALAKRIDGLDYFQILNLPATASPADVKASYYALSRALHPDKFYQLPDMELRNAVNKIFRRVTESYSVLKDDRKRPLYVANISGPDRIKKLRYDEDTERVQRESEREQREVARTPQGKKMYQAAVLELNQGNFEKALKNVQSALLFEAGNETLMRMKAELEAKVKGAAPTG